MKCPECKGRGWVRAPEWVECGPCHASGETGTRAPDEILMSNGRVSRGVHVMYPPAKPKPPELRCV
jgi:hypothetical protein